MPRTSTSPGATVISPDEAAAGILALMIDARESRTKDERDATKTEVILASAGLSIDAIVALTGKKPDAVRKTIQRAKKKP